MTSFAAQRTCSLLPETFSLREINWSLSSLMVNTRYRAWSDSVVKSDDELEPADEEIAAAKAGIGALVG